MNTQPTYIQTVQGIRMNVPIRKTCRVCQKTVNHDDLYLTFNTKNRNKRYVHKECYISRRAQLHDATFNWIKRFEKLWITEYVIEQRRLKTIAGE